MNEKYKDPEFYQIELYRNSLNRINNKPTGHHIEKLGCSDGFYLEWLYFQRREYELVTGCRIKIEEIDHVLTIKHFGNDPRCFEWINLRTLETK